MKRKSLKSLVAACAAAMVFAVPVFAASESLNNGGATWKGGENSDGILYSQVQDNAVDGIRYSVTVWVKSDNGSKSEKSGTTSGVGADGQVKVTRAATHSNPFVAEKCGYKDLVCVSC